MTFLSRSLALDPGDPVHALLSMEEAEAFRAALDALTPEDAALAVTRAPSIHDKSRLIWALEPLRRAEVLDHLHPGFVGALIQNRETENKRLLADLSREQFTRLLRYCSPERAYYWLTLATSFRDTRANMLPLLIPVHDLAAALLTVPEFETHCQEIGDFSTEDLRLDQDFFQELGSATVTVQRPDGLVEEFPIHDPRLRELLEELEHDPEQRDAVVELVGPGGTLQSLPIRDPRLRRLLTTVLNQDPDQYTAITNLFGPEGMLKEFRIRDPRLRRVLQTVIDCDPEHYTALVEAALQISDYQAGHPEDREVVREDPILLDTLLSVEEERERAGLARTERGVDRPRAADLRGVPSLPARQSAELMRAAAAALPAQRQNELSQELQLLFMQEAAYAGGSFAQADLEQAAGRVQSYVQIGLAGLAEGDAGHAAQLLSEQRLRTLMESGARQVERLRQVALRLLPWREVLDSRQLRVLEALQHPDMGVDENGRPVVRIRGEWRGSVQALEPDAMRAELEGISAWITLVRAVGKSRIALRMASPPSASAANRAPKRGGKEEPAKPTGPSAAAVTRSLVVAAILYRYWDPGLVQTEDLARFRAAFVDPETGRCTATAFRALAEAIHTLAADRKLEARAVEEISRLLSCALDELAAEQETRR
jgi:hypothetical protein